MTTLARSVNSKSSEEKHSRIFVRYVFKSGIETWRHVAEALQMVTRGDVSFFIDEDASAKVSLAILGTCLAVLKGHSAVVAQDHGIEIERFCKRSLQKDYELTSDEASEMIDALDEYQRVFGSAMSSNKNPFGEIAGVMICRCLGPQTTKLCVRGTSSLNPVVHQVVADLMTLKITNVLNFWKDK